MLSSISWGQFWILIGIGLVLYYGWVFWQHYRQEKPPLLTKQPVFDEAELEKETKQKND